MLDMNIGEAVLYVVGAVVLGAVGLGMRVKDQSGLDHNRRTYLITSFPAPLPTEQVVNWLIAISGQMRRKGWLGYPSIVFYLECV